MSLRLILEWESMSVFVICVIIWGENKNIARADIKTFCIMLLYVICIMSSYCEIPDHMTSHHIQEQLFHHKVVLSSSHVNVLFMWSLWSWLGRENWASRPDAFYILMSLISLHKHNQSAFSELRVNRWIIGQVTNLNILYILFCYTLCCILCCFAM